MASETAQSELDYASLEAGKRVKSAAFLCAAKRNPVFFSELNTGLRNTHRYGPLRTLRLSSQLATQTFADAEGTNGRTMSLPPLKSARPNTVRVNPSSSTRFSADKHKQSEYEEKALSSACRTLPAALHKLETDESFTENTAVSGSKSLPGSIPGYTTIGEKDVPSLGAVELRAVISQDGFPVHKADPTCTRRSCLDLDCASVETEPDCQRYRLESFESGHSSQQEDTTGYRSVSDSLDFFYDIPLNDDYEELFFPSNEPSHTGVDGSKCRSFYKRLVKKVRNYRSALDAVHSNGRGGRQARVAKQRSHHSDQGPYEIMFHSGERDPRRTRSTTPTRGSDEHDFLATSPVSEHRGWFAGSMFPSSKNLISSLSGSSLFGLKPSRKVTSPPPVEADFVPDCEILSTVSSVHNMSHNAAASCGMTSFLASCPTGDSSQPLDQKTVTHEQSDNCHCGVVIAVLCVALVAILVLFTLIYAAATLTTAFGRAKPSIHVVFKLPNTSGLIPQLDVPLRVNVGEELVVSCFAEITFNKAEEEWRSRNNNSRMVSTVISLELKRRNDSQYRVVASTTPGSQPVLERPSVTATGAIPTKNGLNLALNVAIHRASCLEEGAYRCRLSAPGRNSSETDLPVVSVTKTVQVEGCEQEGKISDENALDFRVSPETIRSDVDEVELLCWIHARLLPRLIDVNSIRIFKHDRNRRVLASVNKGGKARTTDLALYAERGITAKGAVNPDDRNLRLTVAWNSSFPQDLGVYGCEAETVISTTRERKMMTVIINMSSQSLSIEATCPQGSEWTLVGRTCYLYPESQQSKRQEASRNCSVAGAHLVEINDDQELRMLQTFLVKKKTKAQSVWIGLRDGGDPGELRWDTSQTSDFANDTLLKKLTEGPTKTPGTARCFAFSAYKAVVVVACDATLPFLCEQDPLMMVKEKMEGGGHISPPPSTNITATPLVVKEEKASQLRHS